jgi:dihydroorotase
MSTKTIIRNVSIVNEGRTEVLDLLIGDGRIMKIGDISDTTGTVVIDGTV